MNKNLINVVIVFLTVIPLFISCSEDDNVLAPYSGGPELSSILVEESSFKPNITWVGGYAAVFGVNRGTEAKLDSSLVWLVKAEGNNLEYPLLFGETPSGAQNLTAQFGGNSIEKLNEDTDYTFWVMKQDAWDKASSQTGKIFIADSLIESGQVIVNADSLFLSTSFFANYSKSLDVFVNIDGISTFGQLGIISVEETNSGRPIIDWTITQPGVEDSAISVIGICEGSQYDPGTTIWDVYSESTENGNTVYGAVNVINSPLNVGDTIPQTRAFVPFELEGLERDKTYYIWIANDLWDGEGRLRFAAGYAYATFNTN